MLTTTARLAKKLARAQWLQDRQAELLNVTFFHVVFTVPDAIATIAFQNQTAVYDILFRAAAETLRTIAADPVHLGAEIGFMAVLHTWGQNLLHHPHLHCLVPGGGIAPDGESFGSLPARLVMRRPCSLPSCWHSAGPSASALLMDEVVMLASTQTGIDRPAGEWPPLGTLACLAAPEADSSRHRVSSSSRASGRRSNATWPMISAMVSRSSRASSDSTVTPSHESRWSATVLRRAGTAAADAGRVCLAYFRLLAFLDANLVAPRNIQVTS